MNETKIQSVANIDHVKVFFDPLRKPDSFLCLRRDGGINQGFVIGKDIVFESDFHFKWSEITSIMAGFDSIELFENIKTAINEARQ